jgi:hypothetical protein
MNQGPETHHHNHGQLIFDIEAKAIQQRKDSISKNGSEK